MMHRLDWVNTACGKDHSQKNLIETDIKTKSLLMFEETNNLVYKLMTDKLQPVC